MSTLLDKLSNELLHIAFVHLDGPDLASLLATCWPLYHFVKGNSLLHKEIYLLRYDAPGSSAGEPDWEGELQRNVKLERILASSNAQEKRRRLSFVAERVRFLLDTASVDSNSLNRRILNDHFADTPAGTVNKHVFLCSSSLFDEGGTHEQEQAQTFSDRQLSAQLHCLWGRPIDPVPYSRFSSRFRNIRLPRFLSPDDADSPAMHTRLHDMHNIPVHMVARGKVYDLSEYTLPSLWGPFMDDGSHRTDWEKVEAVMVVLGFKLTEFEVRSEGRFPYVWSTPWKGATPRSFISAPPPSAEEHDNVSLFDQMMDDDLDSIAPWLVGQPDPALEALDPYGVTGTWMRVVCFLDYNDLYNYNFHTDLEAKEEVGEGRLRRRPIDTEEAIRLIRIKLRVTKVEPPSHDEREDWDEKPDPDFSEFKGERLPVVHFTGNSRSLHASWDPNANSKIRGSVRQTPSGDIRWTTFSIFHGEERWRSEGIQVGGLRSGRGVLGNWFDKDFDEHGPAGPTAFWKENDSLEDGRRSDGRVVAFF